MGWTFYNASGQRLSTAATSIDHLDIDGGTDIGAAIVDADLFIIDDGAGGTNRKTAASRIATYVQYPDISARVYNDGDQAVANTTNVVLAYNQERFDTDGIHDNSTNNSRLTCNTAGKYFVSFNLNIEFNATGRRAIFIRLNGNNATQWAQINYQTVTTSGVGIVLSASTFCNLAEDDYLETLVYQDSGSSLDVTNVSQYSPEFMMVKIT